LYIASFLTPASVTATRSKSAHFKYGRLVGHTEGVSEGLAATGLATSPSLTRRVTLGQLVTKAPGDFPPLRKDVCSFLLTAFRSIETRQIVSAHFPRAENSHVAQFKKLSQLKALACGELNIGHDSGTSNPSSISVTFRASRPQQANC
jgi:hypothetical protein